MASNYLGKNPKKFGIPIFFLIQSMTTNIFGLTRAAYQRIFIAMTLNNLIHLCINFPEKRTLILLSSHIFVLFFKGIFTYTFI